MKLEYTAYETEPVENIAEAIYALAHAYNRLQDAMRQDVLHAESSKHGGFGERLRKEMGKPVTANAEKSEAAPSISLYEIGIAHAPTIGAHCGPLTVHDGKLGAALKNRASEVKTLFAQEETGLLPRLCRMLTGYRNETKDDEALYPLMVRLTNECRRLLAFWG